MLWRDSAITDVTDRVFKAPLIPSEFKNALKDLNIVNILETKISKKVKESYASSVIKNNAEGRNEDEVIKNWTEGLFRYQAQEITGIVINPNNLESCKKGWAFLQVLALVTKKDMIFYKYDRANLCFARILDEDVCAIVKPYSKEVKEMINKYDDCYTESLASMSVTNAKDGKAK